MKEYPLAVFGHEVMGSGPCRGCCGARTSRGGHGQGLGAYLGRLLRLRRDHSTERATSGPFNDRWRPRSDRARRERPTASDPTTQRLFGRPRRHSAATASRDRGCAGGTSGDRNRRIRRPGGVEPRFRAGPGQLASRAVEAARCRDPTRDLPCRERELRRLRNVPPAHHRCAPRGSPVHGTLHSLRQLNPRPAVGRARDFQTVETDPSCRGTISPCQNRAIPHRLSPL